MTNSKSQNLLPKSLPSMIVISTILIVFTSAASTLFGEDISMEVGKDRQGSDYKNFEIDAGPEACKNACASDAKCQAYTWVRPGVQDPTKAICYLKYTIPEASGNPNCVSGVKLLLPRGLTGGLSYWKAPEVENIGIVDNTATLIPQDEYHARRQAKSGWQVASDGDIGACTDCGFYHQELTSQGGGITSQTPDRFMLPAGTACGFHHTTNSQGSCMGMDPGNSCPNGWIARRHFDMSSGDGHGPCVGVFNPAHCGYFVWCEYADPHKLCEDSDCVQRALRFASVGIKSNTDPTGDTLRFGCPPRTVRTSFYDMGRGEGEGVSFCLYSSSQALPPLPQGSGGLMGAFAFRVEPGAHYSITFTIHGNIENPSGTVGDRTFTKTLTREGIGEVIPKSEGFTVDGLMAGTWRVSASSNITGSVGGCKAVVPGYVTLSVADGPKCGP